MKRGKGKHLRKRGAGGDITGKRKKTQRKLTSVYQEWNQIGQRLLFKEV